MGRWDRFLANSDWLHLFQDSSIIHLPRTHSDYCPILLNLTRATTHPKKSFHFLNYVDSSQLCPISKYYLASLRHILAYAHTLLNSIKAGIPTVSVIFFTKDESFKLILQVSKNWIPVTNLSFTLLWKIIFSKNLISLYRTKKIFGNSNLESKIFMMDMQIRNSFTFL